ncbi:MAG TPA: hypothetical protein PKJ85_02710 [Nitrosomonas nitrosa]|jgi:hypothetical protein|uniref:Uncharacterized protein n=2 Tax=Nitrosomonas nitrosa TaxID=52442 RepID=A0A8H8YZA5_9PROT|nr:conserved hypothetical protein [Nitrosomonas nitrosa]HNP50691.1 hypothetical protein [Nitrosomonas nitrosa]
MILLADEIHRNSYNQIFTKEKRSGKMNKLIISLFVSILAIGSTSTFASGNASSSLTPIRAQDILNMMACKDKKPEEQIKDRTDGTKVKCADVMKKVASSQANGSASGGGY